MIATIIKIKSREFQIFETITLPGIKKLIIQWQKLLVI